MFVLGTARSKSLLCDPGVTELKNMAGSWCSQSQCPGLTGSKLCDLALDRVLAQSPQWPGLTGSKLRPWPWTSACPVPRCESELRGGFRAPCLPQACLRASRFLFELSFEKFARANTVARGQRNCGSRFFHSTGSGVGIQAIKYGRKAPLFNKSSCWPLQAFPFSFFVFCFVLFCFETASYSPGWP